MLEVTRRILDANGYEVLTAAARDRGDQARRSEHDGPIDLLLTDVVMPHMLGKEVAERVAARCGPTSACCSCPATPRP